MDTSTGGHSQQARPNPAALVLARSGGIPPSKKRPRNEYDDSEEKQRAHAAVVDAEAAAAAKPRQAKLEADADALELRAMQEQPSSRRPAATRCISLRRAARATWGDHLPRPAPAKADRLKARTPRNGGPSKSLGLFHTAVDAAVAYAKHVASLQDGAAPATIAPPLERHDVSRTCDTIAVVEAQTVTSEADSTVVVDEVEECEVQVVVAQVAAGRSTPRHGTRPAESPAVHARPAQSDDVRRAATVRINGGWWPCSRARETCRQGCQVRANGAVHASHNVCVVK